MESDILKGLEALQTIEEVFTKQTKAWQRRLRLTDWGVQLKLCRLHEMPSMDCVGAISIFEERKDAVLHLLAPIDLPILESKYPDHEAYNYDTTIVHELLHLHFVPFAEDDETHKGIAQEQAINCISRAIIKAYTRRVIEKPLASSLPLQGYL